MKRIFAFCFLSAFILTACNPQETKSVQTSTLTPNQTATSTPSPISTQENLPKAVYNFANTQCNYSFDYPKEAEIGDNDMVPFEEESSNVFAFLKGDGRLINIECYSTDENLKDYAQKAWQENKDDIANKQSMGIMKTVGDLNEIKFQDEEAYKFSLTGSYKYPNDGGGEILKDPTTIIFIKHNNVNYEIIYLADNQKSEAVLSSFKFTK